MMGLRLTVFCLAILTLAGCTQVPTDPVKATAGKPGTTPSQPLSPPSNPGERGGDGGGGGY
jgi:hypothetical protein